MTRFFQLVTRLLLATMILGLVGTLGIKADVYADDIDPLNRPELVIVAPGSVLPTDLSALFDSNLGSGWGAYSDLDNSSFTVDFGQPLTANGATFFFWSADRPDQFKVEASTTGVFAGEETQLFSEQDASKGYLAYPQNLSIDYKSYGFGQARTFQYLRFKTVKYRNDNTNGTTQINLKELRLFNDVTPPTITLNGKASYTIRQNSSFVDPMATASDTFYGDISALVIASPLVDVTTLGTYTINYTVTDPSGNVSPTISRQVIVAEAGDLSVSTISRTPRTDRYQVAYDQNGPISATGGLVPAVGDLITYTAVLKNTYTIDKAYNYAWRLDGQIVESGQNAWSLIAQQPVLHSYSLIWSATPKTISFEIVPVDAPADVLSNNKREQQTDALSLRFHIEPQVYAVFGDKLNLSGTYGFDDWAQAHVAKMNQMISAGGSSTRVFLDEIIVEDNLPSTGEHAPLDLAWDGRWGFDDSEWSSGKIAAEVGSLQLNLIHELFHQLGLIDHYNLNFDIQYALQNEVNGQAYSMPYQDIMADTNLNFLSEYSSKAITSNDGYRRGCFGDYLYDLPQTNVLLLRDQVGQPISAAQVTVYQATNNRIPNTPVSSGQTNQNGTWALPNRAVVERTTETGHHLTANPFGQVSVIGSNGLLLLKFETNGQTYYDWLSIAEVNMAYWSGNQSSAEYQRTLPFVLPPTQDTTPPVITIIGNNPLTLEKGTAYQELGATAYDDVDGNLTSQITISGTVNTKKIGRYTKVYQVADQSGNMATATRVINVVNTTPPKGKL